MTLYLEDTAVALDPSAGVTLNFVCPAFDDDSTARGYSLPFRVPQTPTTLALLRHKNRLDTSDNSDSIPARIEAQGGTLATGKYKVLKSSNGQFDGHFENESRVNVASLSQLKLHNLLPVIEIPQTVKAVWYLSVLPPTLANGYKVEIDGHEFLGSSSSVHDVVGSRLAESINQYFGENVATWINARYHIRLTTPADGRSFRIRVADHVNFNGINVAGTSLSPIGAQQDNFLHYVRSVLEVENTVLSFGMMANDKLYEGKNLDWLGMINFAELDANNFWQIGKSPPTDLETNWRHTFVPFLRVSYILKRIADALKVSAVASDIPEWTELMTLVVYNNHTLDDIKQSYEFYDLTYTNVHAVRIEPKNHVPNMSVSDFLSQFCEAFNLFWAVENERLIFKEKDLILRGPVGGDFSAYIVKDTDERGYKTDKGFKLALTTEDTDGATSAAIKPYIEGDGGEVITLPVGTLPEKVVWLTHPLTFFWSSYAVCFSDQKRQDSPSLLRFMFDRSPQLGNADNAASGIPGKLYVPTASAARHGVLSLSPAFLFSRFWRESAYYRASAWSFEASFQLPMSVLCACFMWQNCLRRIETRHGSRIGAIYKVQVMEKVSGMMEVKIEFKVR